MSLHHSRGTLPALLLALALLLGACGTAAPPTLGPTVLPNPDEIVVEQIDLLLLESFPVQVHVVVKGQFPDACSQIEQVQQSRQGNDITVDLTLSRRPDAKCAPQATPFEQNIPLDVAGLPAGVYRVTVNGVTGTFELAVDNALPTEAVPSTPDATPQAGDIDTDLAAFEAELQAALRSRDAARLQALMFDPFGIALERSEGTFYPPAEAVEQLRANYLAPDAELQFETAQDLAGVDVAALLSPDVELMQAIRVGGWGPRGADQALLFIVRAPYGGLYWHSVVIQPASVE